MTVPPGDPRSERLRAKPRYAERAVEVDDAHGVAQHLGDEIKVVRCHLPELEPGGFEDRSHVTTRRPTTGESETPRVSLGATNDPAL